MIQEEPDVQMQDPPGVPVPAVRFEHAADEVSRKVNRAFSRLVGHLPGRINRATELQRFLKIDSKLAWQIFTVAKAEDPLAQTRHIPSMISVRRVTAAAGERGVPLEVLEGIHAAVEEFERVGKRYAGDRSSFATMVSSIRNKEVDSRLLALQQRRGAYRLNCQLWGAQIETSFTHYAFRAEENGTFSSILLNVKAGFQLLRSQTNPPVYGSWQFATNVRANQQSASEAPLDPEALVKYGSPLLPDFCSHPVPRLEQIRHADDWVLRVLKTDQLGKLGAVDLTHGVVHRNRPISALNDGRKFLYIAIRQATPVENCIAEMVIHRPSFGKLKASLQTIPASNGNLVAELANPTTNFPCHEMVLEMGPVSEVAPVGDIPRYSDLLAYAYKQVGWDPSEFDVYRVTIPHPVLGTDAVVWSVLGS